MQILSDRFVALFVRLVFRAKPQDWVNEQKRTYFIFGPIIGCTASFLAFVFIFHRLHDLRLALAAGIGAGAFLYCVWGSLAGIFAGMKGLAGQNLRAKDENSTD